jgi:hypothetical protein
MGKKHFFKAADQKSASVLEREFAFEFQPWRIFEIYIIAKGVADAMLRFRCSRCGDPYMYTVA